ncbi:ATP-binding cassette domain-containing protein [Mycoplasmopsis columboralis]|uniref:ABC transporter ATPase n=1 Tax=Mycoplasmopsis columboralis TaxID=171282 RepID=A0A449B5L9_9BACT|nr:ABC transporter ATP-binding protein [Mycoplasmopsis columboralis]VEU75900.1 ABC transporter ATPase [Mycoplasmopsis columboralis]
MIEIKNLYKKFGKKTVIENLDLSIESNCLFFIVGKSGTGKTTLLNTIAGFEKIDNGTINIFDENKQLINLDRTKFVDVVFQNFNLIGDLNVLDNLIFGLQILGISSSVDYIKKVCAEFNINEQLLKSKAKDLSGGEKQRVSIVRTFLRNSKFILFDEPTGNLDDKNTDIVFDTIASIKKDRTIVIVTHDIESAYKYGDYIYDLNKKVLTKNTTKNDLQSKQVFKSKNQYSRSWINKWKSNLLILKKDLKKRWLQFSIILLSFMLSLLFLGGSINLVNTSKIVSKEKKIQTNWDLNKVLKKYDDVQLSFNPIEEDIIKSNSIGVNYPIYLSDKIRNNVTLSNGDKKIEINKLDLQSVNFDEYSKNRFKGVNGNFIREKNEVILDEETINKLGINKNDLGQIKLNINFQEENNLINNEYNLTVIDYTKANNIDKKGHNYISVLLEKVIQNFVLSNINKWRVIKYNLDKSAYFKNNISIGKYSDETKLLKGRKPENYAEIVVSKKFLKDTNWLWNDENFLISKLDFNFKFKSVGYFESDEFDVLLSEKAFSFLQSNFFVNGYNVFLENNQNFRNSTKTIDDLIIETQKLLLIEKIKFANKTIQIVLLFANLALGCLFILLIIIITKMFVDSKKKETGIFKALKANWKQILLYHLSSIILILLLTLLLTFVSFYPTELILNSLSDLRDIIEIDIFSSLSNYLLLWITYSLFWIFIYILWLSKYFLSSTSKLLKN